MSKKMIFGIIGVIFLIGIATAIIYEPRCSIRDNPFGSEKTYVKIGEEHESWGSKYICEQKDKIHAELKQIAFRPNINIHLYNSTAESYESAYPKLNAQVFIGDNLMGVVENGDYESDRFYFPYCDWDESIEVNGFKGMGNCDFNLTIKGEEFVCEVYLGKANYVQHYRIDLNQCVYPTQDEGGKK